MGWVYKESEEEKAFSALHESIESLAKIMNDPRVVVYDTDSIEKIGAKIIAVRARFNALADLIDLDSTPGEPKMSRV